MGQLFRAVVLLLASLLINGAICSVATASPIDQNMPKQGGPPRSLIPGAFTLEQPVAEAEKLLLDDGFALTSTRAISILLDRHIPSYKDGDRFDFRALGAFGPTSSGTALAFGKDGPRPCCCAYYVRLGATDDGKLEFAQAFRSLNQCGP